MKSFLLILLIVVANLTEVQHLVTRKLGGNEKVYDWLLACGMINQLSNILTKYGIVKAIEFCEGKVPKLLKKFCKGFVETFKG